MNIQKMSKSKEVQVDYKLRAFIIFLFVVIVCVLKFAHVYYDRHVLQVSIRIRTDPDRPDRPGSARGLNRLEPSALRFFTARQLPVGCLLISTVITSRVYRESTVPGSR